LQDPPKFTQIGIFGLKIYHLATVPQHQGDQIGTILAAWTIVKLWAI
jgi:hypothetical protein